MNRYKVGGSLPRWVFQRLVIVCALALVRVEPRGGLGLRSKGEILGSGLAKSGAGNVKISRVSANPAED